MGTLTAIYTHLHQNGHHFSAQIKWLGFDPQPNAELAQGEYKGAREVLARHVHTAEPRGGPGGVLRTQRTTQPSCELDVLF